MNEMVNKCIVFLDSQTFPDNVISARPKIAHEWTVYKETAPNEIVERLSKANVAMVNKVVLDHDVLSQLPNLELIVVTATGYNNVDIAYCQSKNIAVCNVTGYAEQTVAEHTIAMLLNLSRNMIAYYHDVQANAWESSPIFCLNHHKIEDLFGKTLGIIGQGTIGTAVAKLAESFGMRVQFLAPTHKDTAEYSDNAVDWETFLAESDVISIHCPLTEQTENLIDKAAFKQMHKKPIIINTARGGIVNETDAADALLNGQISALGFDVLTQEPMPSNHPFKAIMHLPNVLITPHNAWASQKAMQTLWSQAVQNIDAFYSDLKANRVV